MRTAIREIELATCVRLPTLSQRTRQGWGDLADMRRSIRKDGPVLKNAKAPSIARGFHRYRTPSARHYYDRALTAVVNKTLVSSDPRRARESNPSGCKTTRPSGRRRPVPTGNALLNVRLPRARFYASLEDAYHPRVQKCYSASQFGHERKGTVYAVPSEFFRFSA